MSPLHECEPPVEGATLNSSWVCPCGNKFKLKKAVVFAPAYEENNRMWVRKRISIVG